MNTDPNILFKTGKHLSDDYIAVCPDLQTITVYEKNTSATFHYTKKKQLRQFIIGLIDILATTPDDNA